MHDRIPLIILAKERPIQLREMVDAIVRKSDPQSYCLIIVDNGSTQPEMLAYLKAIETIHTIIYLGQDALFEGFNAGLALVPSECDHFILSDPDIVIPDTIPGDWIWRLSTVLNELPIPKVGLALSVRDLPNVPLSIRTSICEQDHWRYPAEVKSINQPCFFAPIDTTMAMCRRDTFLPWANSRRLAFTRENGLIVPVAGWISQDHYNRERYPLKPIRVAGTYTAKHTGWWITPEYEADNEYYKTHANLTIASTLRWRKETGN